MTPFVVNKIPGGGWMFPKRSPFFPIFNQYFIVLKEEGIFKRIMESYDDNPGLPPQVCNNYDGKPIKINKIFSLFAIIAGGIGMSTFLFW